jgi:predicted chitinase
MLSQIKSAFNNQFVSADNQGASPLVANRGTAQEWETFNVINNSDGTISFQAVANNKYVTADLNQETKLIARATEIQAWEKFRKIDRGNGKIALQAVANNLYVSADLSNGAVLYANRPSASGWEEFFISSGSGSGSAPSTPQTGGFVVSEQQFNQIYPNRNGFYTYSGLVAALGAYPGFARTGGAAVQKQEAAAFLANVYHETGGLYYIVEQNTANYSHYSDPNNTRYPSTPGKQYYGRGPLQISWNYNYGAAGEALGLPLLANPDLVAQDSSVAWKTGLWFWNTQTGAGTMTCHDAMVHSRGFGETIRTINGALECNRGGGGPVQSRVEQYKRISGILGVDPGNNLSC